MSFAWPVNEKGTPVTIDATQVGAAGGDQFFAPGGSLTYNAITTLAVRLGSGSDAVHTSALAGTALSLDAELVTNDKRLSRTPGLRCRPLQLKP